MFDGHQRDDVARRSQILRGVELPVQARKILRVFRFEIERPICVRRECISKMTYSPMSAGDVPTSPAILDRSSMIDAFEERSRHKRCSIRRWIDRRNNQ